MLFNFLTPTFFAIFFIISRIKIFLQAFKWCANVALTSRNNGQGEADDISVELQAFDGCSDTPAV